MSIKEIMEVKEAIEKIESIYDCHENDRACSKEDRKDIQKEKEQIKELLQQGEAIRQMWERLCKKLFEPHFNYTWSCNAFEIMEEIEQKYFPKDVSQNYEESEE